MRETCELRVVEEFADRLFAPTEGKLLGSGMVRKIELSTSDPRFQRVGELQKLLHKTLNRSFFHGWSLTHTYTKEELEAAALFHLRVTSHFEPAGEQCGTTYDETTACSQCKAGAKQTSALILPLSRIPKGKDVSRTIAGEIVVSRRLKELFDEHALTGVEFRPLRHNRASSAESADWFQPVIQSIAAEIVPPTKTGVDPFDEDKADRFRCPKGDLIGLNLLSEITAVLPSGNMPDILSSRQFVGTRRGLLRPERLIFVSPKLRRLMTEQKMRGVEFEVAHVAKNEHADQSALNNNTDLFPCPVCKSKVLSARGEYEICKVCGWEDEPAQSANPDLDGGANSDSLNKAIAKWNSQRALPGQ